MGDLKWTPGPWNAGHFSSVVGIPIMAQPDKTQNTLVIASTMQAASREEAEANAALIASAPDLYAALAMLEKFVTDGFETQAKRMFGRKALIAARAALARAARAGGGE